MLVDTHAGGAAGPSQTEGIVERMQVGCAGIEDPPVVERAVDDLPHGVPAEDPLVPVRMVPGETFRAPRQAGQVRRLRRAHQLTGSQLAVDGMSGDAFLDEVSRRNREPEELVGSIPAKARPQFGLVPALSRAQLPAIAAGCAPAHPPGFEQDDRVAAFGQVQGGGEARVAGTNDADVSLSGTLEGDVLRQSLRGGEIPGGRVIVDRDAPGCAKARVSDRLRRGAGPAPAGSDRAPSRPCRPAHPAARRS